MFRKAIRKKFLIIVVVSGYCRKDGSVINLLHRIICFRAIFDYPF